jgi:hypothetical protein
MRLVEAMGLYVKLTPFLHGVDVVVPVSRCVQSFLQGRIEQKKGVFYGPLIN